MESMYCTCKAPFLAFLFEQFQRSFADAIAVDAIIGKQLLGVAQNDILIRQSHNLHGNGMVLDQQLRNSAAQTAVDAVFLHGKDAAGFLGCFKTASRSKGLTVNISSTRA